MEQIKIKINQNVFCVAVPTISENLAVLNVGAGCLKQLVSGDREEFKNICKTTRNNSQWRNTDGESIQVYTEAVVFSFQDGEFRFVVFKCPTLDAAINFNSRLIDFEVLNLEALQANKSFIYKFENEMFDAEAVKLAKIKKEKEQKRINNLEMSKIVGKVYINENKVREVNGFRLNDDFFYFQDGSVYRLAHTKTGLVLYSDRKISTIKDICNKLSKISGIWNETDVKKLIVLTLNSHAVITALGHNPKELYAKFVRNILSFDPDASIEYIAQVTGVSQDNIIYSEVLNG